MNRGLRHDSASQRAKSKKSPWRKSAFCCTPKARESHKKYSTQGKDTKR